MGIIHQLSPHVANLIAAGEVVERPASVVKELLENAIDAGASHITVEVQNGGMTFLRLTDDGCGMTPEDAETAFLRHATSKLHTGDDLAAIATLGFRGEALAAISSVSRIDLLTRTSASALGVSLHLEAGKVVSRTEAGCPEGTTIIVRDLFFNTPARMKFMKRDSVEGAAVFACVQKQAIAHPGLAVRFLRDGKQELSTPGDGKLYSAIYSVLGRQAALDMTPMEASWEKTQVTGFISKPTASRGNRSYQIFFVNGRYVRSSVLSAALEEAYKNQLMVGRFPACVLSLTIPLPLVDVNIHPAKTEIKFLNERDAFDCVYYGALSALGQLSGRVDAKLPHAAPPQPAAAPQTPAFRKMSAEEFRTVMAPPKTEAPPALVQAVQPAALREPVKTPSAAPAKKAAAPAAPAAPEQLHLPLPKEDSYRIIGECFSTYFLVEEGEALYLIDKHAAHERILFDRLRARQEAISPQALVQPIACGLAQEEAAIVLEYRDLLLQCGFGVEEFGSGTVLLREIPQELSTDDAQASLSALAQCLMDGGKLRPEALRDELLHTVACKAAIKAGYRTDPAERQALVRQVLEHDELKYCPHGRPICIRLTKGQLERQFGR